MSAPSAAARAERGARVGGRAALAPLLPPALLALLALALMLAGASVARPGLAVAADDPAAGRSLVRFHGVERNATDAYRWSEPLAGVFLYGYEGRPAVATLRLAAPRPAGEPPAVARARSGGAELGAFAVAGDWRRYHLLAPTRPAGETALLLETPAFTPPGDPRELGVALSAAWARPAAYGGLMPVRALYLLALPLLGWLALRRLGAPGWAAMGFGLALALGAGWAAAAPTASGYWLPTLGWPLWPALPLLLLALWPRLAPRLAAARALLDRRPALGWLGLGLALAALLLMRAGLPPTLGMAALALGVWAGLSSAEPEVRATETGRDARLLPLALLATLAVALFVRLYDLGGQPAGLWRDESRHGLQALRIWGDPGYRPIYVVEGADLPALLFYLMAPVVGLLGPEAWSARLVSALAGALTPLALYWAAGPMLGRRATLLAAALAAWASWSLSMSRWAFPATLDHLLVLTAVGLVWRCLPGGPRTKDQRPRSNNSAAPRAEPAMEPGDGAPSSSVSGRWSFLGMALAGLLGGLAVYAYHTGRVAPLALAAVTALRLGPSPAAWRRALPGLAAAALVGALTVAPLAAYILGDLEGYNRRVGSVSILDSNDPNVHSPLGLLLGNLGRYALAYHVEGDGNGRHHMPAAPLLDPVAGLLMALGLALAVTRARSSPGLAAALALGAVYLVPGVFSGNAPHAMRSLGTLAPALMLAGAALDALLEAQSAKRKAQAEAATGHHAVVDTASGRHAALDSRRRPHPRLASLGSPFPPPPQLLRRGRGGRGVRSAATPDWKAQTNYVLGPPSTARAALVGAALAASLAFNLWLYFGAMRVEPTVYGEFDLLETTMGRVARAPADAADPELRAVRVFLPEKLRGEDTVRFLTWGLPVGAYTGAPLPADGPALVILPAAASPAEQAAALAALGPGAAALGPTASYPGTGAPVALAFGRGEAAASLLKQVAGKGQ